jgi:hypothetical protein
MKTFIPFVLLIVLIGLGIWLAHKPTSLPVTTTQTSPSGSTVPATPVNSNLSQMYENKKAGFSIHYPSGYAVDDANPNQVKFTIPVSLTTGTNLSTDSYLAVEQIPNAQSCTADLFYDTKVETSTVSDKDGTTYSYATYTDAAAGNRYESIVYALPGTNPCVAVHYLIHYGVLDNYPPGEVQAFDEQALLDTFNQIRESLVLEQ